MYRAYKILLDQSLFEELESSAPISQSDTNYQAFVSSFRDSSVRSKLMAMIENASLASEDLNAEDIWDDWFPRINTDVFISHSSQDADLAKKFSVWLKSNFGLNPTFTTIFHKSLIVNTWLIFFGHYNLFATVSFLRSAL